MAKLSILAGATSQSVTVFIQDSSVTTGVGLSGLAFNTTNIIAYYAFTGANGGSNAITLATLAAANSAYSSGGFKEIDASNMKGMYRFDIPNAAIAGSKGRSSVIMISGAANMVPCVLEIELTGWDNQDAVHGGLTCLPNTAVTTNGSLITSGTGTAQISTSSGQVILQTGTGTGQLDFTSGVVKSNMVQVLGGACPAVTVTGVPKVDLADILGTAVSAPATAGILDVNIKNISNSAVSTASAQLGVNVVNAGGTAWASGSLTSGVFAAGAINAAAYNADTGFILRANTATAAAAGSLTLDAGATTTVDYYKDCWLVITSSTGIGQARRISAYSAGRVASVTPNWATTPSATSTYAILPHGYTDIGAILGTASAGAAGSVGIDWGQVSNPSTSVNLSGTTVNLVNTLTTYTSNTPQTGDSFARIGATGSGLTSLAPASTALSTVQWTNTLATNLGTLAGHDPGATLGTSTLTQTQVTGGTYSIQSSSCVLGDARIADLDATVSSRSTYAGGDTSGTTTLLARLSATRAGYLDNLSAGAVALASGVIVTTNNDKTGYALTSAYDIMKGNVALTESYAGLHVVPSLSQILFEIRSLLAENSVASTTVTAKQIDGSTIAETFTLNDATSPTSITRAS